MKSRSKWIIWFAGLLAVAMLAAACGGAKTPDTGTETRSGNLSEEVTTDDVVTQRLDKNGYLMDDLPEKANLNRDIAIYTWQDQKAWEWYDDEANAPTQLVDKVLFARQANIEERFNVKLVRDYASGAWDARNDFIKALANHVLYNDHAYDLVGQYTPAAGIGTMQGLYQNLMQVENLDFSKPWWPSKLLDSGRVGEKLYFASGDITPTLIRNVHCMFVNTDLYEQYNLADEVDGRSIFDVVRDYDWTMETMKKLALDQVDPSVGIYGLAIDNNAACDSFLYGGGFTMVKNNESNIPVPSDDLTKQTFINWFEIVQNLATGGRADIIFSNQFKNNKTIFFVGSVAQSQTFAKEGVQFTVLPMPMYDDSQDTYYTCANLWVTLYSIPRDASNAAESGMILEALGSEGYRTMSDEIYYNLFQIRYNSSAEKDSADMFDLVSDSVVFDIVRPFADKLAMFASFRNGVIDSTANWTSIYGAQSGTWKSNVTSLFATVG